MTTRDADGAVAQTVVKDILLDPTGPRLYTFLTPLLLWLQYGTIKRAELFTLVALTNRLKFSKKLFYPKLEHTGQLEFVQNSNRKLVVALINCGVITTSKFVAEDLREDAPGDRVDLRQIFCGQMRHCPDAQIDELVARYDDFKPPHRSEISRALNALLRLGIVRSIEPSGRKSRVVFNPHFVAATKSGIARGILAAEEVGNTNLLNFSSDIGEAKPLRKSTATGKRRYITRDEWRDQAQAREKENEALKKENALLIERLEEGDAPLNTPVAEKERKK